VPVANPKSLISGRQKAKNASGRLMRSSKVSLWDSFVPTMNGIFAFARTSAANAHVLAVARSSSCKRTEEARQEDIRCAKRRLIRFSI
jgi:hypothetical protein